MFSIWFSFALKNISLLRAIFFCYNHICIFSIVFFRAAFSFTGFSKRRNQGEEEYQRPQDNVDIWYLIDISWRDYFLSPIVYLPASKVWKLLLSPGCKFWSSQVLFIRLHFQKVFGECGGNFSGQELMISPQSPVWDALWLHGASWYGCILGMLGQDVWRRGSHSAEDRATGIKTKL